MCKPSEPLDLHNLCSRIEDWAVELGFEKMGVSSVNLGEHGEHLQRWLARGFHGEMRFMAEHGDKRWRPDKLEPGTIRVLSFRMDYLPLAEDPRDVLENSNKAYIARYTLG